MDKTYPLPGQPYDSEKFLPPAMCSYKPGDDEFVQEQNKDRERIVNSLALDVHYELNVLTNEGGLEESRLTPFNPRISSPACPYNYTGKFVEETVHQNLYDDPIKLGEQIEGKVPYDAAIYKKRDPRLTSKTVIMRDFGCKVPIDPSETEKIARAVLNYYPDQYLAFLNEFVSNLFGDAMKTYISLQIEGYRKLLDSPGELNRVSWGAYAAVSGRPREDDTTHAFHPDPTLKFDDAVKNELNKVALNGVTMTGNISAQDLYDLRPCIRQHIETLKMMHDEMCKSYASSETDVLVMMYYANEQGRRLCHDRRLLEDHDSPDYSKIVLHVPTTLHHQLDANDITLESEPDRLSKINGSLLEKEKSVSKMVTFLYQVGRWSGSEDAANVFLSVAQTASAMWGWGHPMNLFHADLPTPVVPANPVNIYAPYLHYKFNAPANTFSILKDGESITFVKSSFTNQWLNRAHRHELLPSGHVKNIVGLRESFLEEPLDTTQGEGAMHFRGTERYGRMGDFTGPAPGVNVAGTDVKDREIGLSTEQPVICSLKDDEVHVLRKSFYSCGKLHDKFLSKGGCLKLLEKGYSIDRTQLDPFDTDYITTNWQQFARLLGSGAAVTRPGPATPLEKYIDSVNAISNRLHFTQGFLPLLKNAATSSFGEKIPIRLLAPLQLVGAAATHYVHIYDSTMKFPELVDVKMDHVSGSPASKIAHAIFIARKIVQYSLCPEAAFYVFNDPLDLNAFTSDFIQKWNDFKLPGEWKVRPDVAAGNPFPGHLGESLMDPPPGGLAAMLPATRLRDAYDHIDFTIANQAGMQLRNEYVLQYMYKNIQLRLKTLIEIAEEKVPDARNLDALLQRSIESIAQADARTFLAVRRDMKQICESKSDEMDFSADFVSLLLGAGRVPTDPTLMFNHSLCAWAKDSSNCVKEYKNCLRVRGTAPPAALLPAVQGLSDKIREEILNLTTSSNSLVEVLECLADVEKPYFRATSAEELDEMKRALVFQTQNMIPQGDDEKKKEPLEQYWKFVTEVANVLKDGVDYVPPVEEVDELVKEVLEGGVKGEERELLNSYAALGEEDKTLISALLNSQDSGSVLQSIEQLNALEVPEDEREKARLQLVREATGKNWAASYDMTATDPSPAVSGSPLKLTSSPVVSESPAVSGSPAVTRNPLLKTPLSTSTPSSPSKAKFTAGGSDPSASGSASFRTEEIREKEKTYRALAPIGARPRRRALIIAALRMLRIRNRSALNNLVGPIHPANTRSNATIANEFVSPRNMTFLPITRTNKIVIPTDFSAKYAPCAPTLRPVPGGGPVQIGNVRPKLFSMLDASAILWNNRAFHNPSDSHRPRHTEEDGVDNMHTWCMTYIESFISAREYFTANFPGDVWEVSVGKDPQKAFPTSLIGSLCDASFKKFFPLIPLDHKMREKIRKIRALNVMWGTLPSYSTDLGVRPGAWMPLSEAHRCRLLKTVGLFDNKHQLPSNPWIARERQGLGRIYNQSYHSVYPIDNVSSVHYREWVKKVCRYQPPQNNEDRCVYPFSQYGGTPVEADFLHHIVGKLPDNADEYMKYRHSQLIYNRFGFTKAMRLGQQFKDNGYLQDLYSWEYRRHIKLTKQQLEMKSPDELYISNFMAYARNHAIIALSSVNHGTEGVSQSRIVRNLYRMFVDAHQVCTGLPNDTEGVPLIMGYLPHSVVRPDDRPVVMYAGTLPCMNAKLERFCFSGANRGERVCENYKQSYLNDAALLFSRLIRSQRRKEVHLRNFRRVRSRRGRTYTADKFFEELVDVQDAYIEFLQTTLLSMALEADVDMKSLPLHLLEPRDMTVNLHEEDTDVVGNDFLGPRTLDIVKDMNFDSAGLTKTQLAILSLMPPNHRILGTLRLNQRTEVVDLEHLKKQIQRNVLDNNKKVWSDHMQKVIRASLGMRFLEENGPIDFSIDESSFKDPIAESEKLPKRITTNNHQMQSILTQGQNYHTLRRNTGPDSILRMQVKDYEEAKQIVRNRVQQEYEKARGLKTHKECLLELPVPQHVKDELSKEYKSSVMY